MHTLMKICLSLLVSTQIFASPSTSINHLNINSEMHAIEKKYHITIGLYAQDTNNNKVIAHRANERFPFQSTFKFIAVSALLAKDSNTPKLNKKVAIRKKDIVPWHPISGKYLNRTVALKTLAQAAIAYSDNTAVNMIIQELGGLHTINQFMHSIGATSFQLSHYEVKLNSNPRIKQDSIIPKDMALSLNKILLGTALEKKNNALLTTWMRNNTTGYNRIRAGVPLGWAVADKTGSGHYGIANDVGIAWSPSCKPVILSIFSVSENPMAKPNDAIIKEVTQAVFKAFTPHDACYKTTTIS